MNSLTTVGGTVINAETIDVEPKRSVRRINMRRVRSVDDDHHFRDPPDGDEQDFRNQRGVASFVGRGGDDIVLVASAAGTEDDIDGPLTIRSTARSATTRSSSPTSAAVTARGDRKLSPATLSRHRSAPIRSTIDNVEMNELDFRPPRPTARGSFSPRSSPGNRRANMSSPRLSRTSTPTPPESREPTISETNTISVTGSRVMSKPTTTPTSLSPAALATKQSIVHTLLSLSQTEPYGSSPYFTRIFDQGIANLEKYNGERGELDNVEGALRICFNVNEDMVSVIAATAYALVEKDAAMERVAAAKNERDTTLMDQQRMLEESEILSNSIIHHHNQRLAPVNQQRQPKPWETPSNLSGYTQRSGDTTPKRTNSIPAAPVRSVSLPMQFSTSQTPGKQQHQLHSSAHSSTYTSEDMVDEASHPIIHQYETPTTSTTNIDSDRKEEARRRVQQYLNQIDNRIRSVKHPQGVARGGGAPKMVTRGVSDGAVAMMNPRSQQQGQERVVRPWDSFDVGMSAHDDERAARNGTQLSSKPMKVFLPSLESPSDDWEQQQQHQQNVLFSNSSVFRDTVAGVEEAKHLPFDESNSRTTSSVPSPPFNGLFGPAETPNINKNSSDNKNNATALTLALTPEERIRQVEKSVGLKSIPEYKQLLQQKTLEIKDLEEQYQSLMDQSEQETEERDEEVKHFRAAMKEAERAVSTLEQAIADLGEASREKDELICQLEGRVRELEEELETSMESYLQKAKESEEHTKELNESVSRMGSVIEERDGDVKALKGKTTELEAELLGTLAEVASSREELATARSCIASRDELLRVSEQELTSTRELLQGQMDLYKNDIACSLENTTRVMDLMSKEKDSLIDSLNAKIAILEGSLAELDEEKERGEARGLENEKEMNDKIQTLALALTQKDTLIGEFRKEIEDSRKETATKKTQTAATAVSSQKVQTGRVISMKEKKSKGTRDMHAQAGRRRKSRSAPRQRESPQEDRHEESRHQDSRPEERHPNHQYQTYHHRYHRTRMEPVRPEGHYGPPPKQGGGSTYDTEYLSRINHDDARDDEVAVMYKYDDEIMVDEEDGRFYYVTSADGDSIFDFSS